MGALSTRSDSLALIPKWFFAAVLSVTAAPFFLSLFGVNFASIGPELDLSAAPGMTPNEALEAMFAQLVGSFTHTLLEWSACVVALFTVILAFVHFRIKGDVITPIIALALFWAGSMDAFHTLAADRLIEATADNTNLIPFTWAICRAFNAIIPLTAFAMIFFARSYPIGSARRSNTYVVAAIGLMLGAAAYGIINYLATSATLPQTMFPDRLVTRPWDVYPLAVYAVSGFLVYPLFTRRIKSHFTYALWLSVIPDTATQLHMAFGSTALFDHHFNIAHFLKIVAYMVPLTGLILDYVYTYRQEIKAVADLEASRLELERQKEGLIHSNAELQQFAYAASHDLQEPLRSVSNFAQLLSQEYKGRLDSNADEYIDFLTDGARRMKELIDDLLAISVVDAETREFTPTSSESLVRDAISNLDTAIRESGAEVSFDPLPTVFGDPKLLTSVFQNLVGNAIKFRREGEVPRVHISAVRQDGSWTFSVRDNGIGIQENHFERVFVIFKRLNPRTEYGGTGIGLALAKKIVEGHGGRMWVESEPDKGSIFLFTIPAETVAEGVTT